MSNDPRIRYVVQPGPFIHPTSVAPTLVQPGRGGVTAIDNLDGMPLMDEGGQYIQMGEGKLYDHSVSNFAFFRQFANSPIFSTSSSSCLWPCNATTIVKTAPLSTLSFSPASEVVVTSASDHPGAIADVSNMPEAEETR